MSARAAIERESKRERARTRGNGIFRALRYETNYCYYYRLSATDWSSVPPGGRDVGAACPSERERRGEAEETLRVVVVVVPQQRCGTRSDGLRRSARCRRPGVRMLRARDFSIGWRRRRQRTTTIGVAASRTLYITFFSSAARSLSQVRERLGRCHVANRRDDAVHLLSPASMLSNAHARVSLHWTSS